jgi:hypothetical protein
MSRRHHHYEYKSPKNEKNKHSKIKNKTPRELNEEIVNQEITSDEIKEEQDTELNKYNCNKDIFFDKSYKFMTYCFDFTYKSIIFVFKVSGVYLLWILLHYVASHLYVSLCVPKTIIGFVMSPFMTATPHCQGLRWIVFNAANMINNMWIILGTWICSTLLIINRNNTDAYSS